MAARVECGGEAWTVPPQEVLTFGRSEGCTICMRPYDEGVSRWAGSVLCEAGTWWVVDESKTRPFEVVDQVGLAHTVPPGGRHAVDGNGVNVLLAGLTYRYSITVTLNPPPARARAPHRTPTGATTVGVGEAMFTHNERLALVALFAGYLEPFPWNTSEPATYREGANRLDISPNALRRRIEHLRDKLTDAGVPNLYGPQARRHLAAYVLATRVITAEDLRLLPPR